MNNWLYFFRNFRLPVCEALRLPFPSEVPCPGNPKAFKKNVKAFEVKRQGVWVKRPRRFRKVCITSHIPILPRQDTISYRHKISNLTATRLVIFRRKLVGDRSERRYKSSCHRKQPMIQKVRLRWQECMQKSKTFKVLPQFTLIGCRPLPTESGVSCTNRPRPSWMSSCSRRRLRKCPQQRSCH